MNENARPLLLRPFRTIRETLRAWFTDRSNGKAFVLVGAKDYGKTVLCQRLVTEVPELLGAAVVLLDLRNLTELHHRVPTRKEMVSECLARGYYDSFTYHDYQKLLERDRVLVMVDGVESAMEQLTAKDREVFMREVFRLAPSGDFRRLLITCRPETLELDAFRGCFKVEMLP